eukprot:2018510-Pleurochrysis_carterae.AAC.2
MAALLRLLNGLALEMTADVRGQTCCTDENILLQLQHVRLHFSVIRLGKAVTAVAPKTAGPGDPGVLRRRHVNEQYRWCPKEKEDQPDAKEEECQAAGLRGSLQISSPPGQAADDEHVRQRQEEKCRRKHNP